MSDNLYKDVTSYEGLLRVRGIDVLEEVSSDDYQGDSLALVKDGFGQYGFSTWGWGSCSGCDALEDALYGYSNDNVIARLRALSDDIISAIKWFNTREEVVEYVNTNDWSASFLDEDLIQDFKEEIK